MWGVKAPSCLYGDYMKFEIETKVITGYEDRLRDMKTHSVSWCELADKKKCMGQHCPAWHNCCSKGRVVILRKD